MEVVASEITGGVYCSLLCVEVKGKKYPKNPVLLGPTLPIFKTEELDHSLADLIHRDLIPGDASVTNGPVFRDYTPKSVAASLPEPQAEESPQMPAGNEMRLWERGDGKAMEAKFVVFIGDKAVFETPNGKKVKVPVSEISAEDRACISLSNPPEFEIDFTKNSRQIPPPPVSPFNESAIQRPLRIFDYTFGARIRQKTAREYPHRLKMEYFAFGEEVEGNAWVYLDRCSAEFTLSDENKRTFDFKGKPVRIQSQATRDSAPMRGTKYGGFVVTLTDERGAVIDYKASHEFLYEHLKKITSLPVNAYFNRDGERVVPTRAQAGHMREKQKMTYTPQDFRFTAKGNTVYVIGMQKPGSGEEAVIESLSSDQLGGTIQSVEVVGGAADIVWTQNDRGLVLTPKLGGLPGPCYCIKITM